LAAITIAQVAIRAADRPDFSRAFAEITLPFDKLL